MLFDDKAGNVLSVTEWENFGGLQFKGRTVNEYDELYRVTKETRLDPEGGTYQVTSAYDPSGNRTHLRQPDGSGGTRSLSYSYDRQGRMTSGGGASYTYDVNGNRTGCGYPNGMAHEYAFDYLNRVTTCDTTNVTQGDVYHCGYTYDLVGNRTHITESVKGADAVTRTRVLDYAYDDEYRLLTETWESAEVGDGSYAYTYDRHGNRKSMTKNGVVTSYTYDNRTNELKKKTTSGATTDYRYDPAGNRISKSEPGKLTRYWYDQFNRLDTVTVDEGAGDEIVFQAEYDFRTRRTWKYEKGSGWTHFRYDGGVSFDEWKVNASTGWAQTVEFTRGFGMGGGIGSIIYADRTGTREYFHYNAVGHTVAQTSDTRSVIASNLYEAFGDIVSHTGSDANNRLANTKERDESIGLDNHGFRYYDPEIGRYLTRDPVGYLNGMNVYVYVGNNPINYADPLGLEEHWVTDVEEMADLLDINDLKKIERVPYAIKKAERGGMYVWMNEGDPEPDRRTSRGFVRRWMLGEDVMSGKGYVYRNIGTKKEFEEGLPNKDIYPWYNKELLPEKPDPGKQYFVSWADIARRHLKVEIFGVGREGKTRTVGRTTNREDVTSVRVTIGFKGEDADAFFPYRDYFVNWPGGEWHVKHNGIEITTGSAQGGAFASEEAKRHELRFRYVKSTGSQPTELVENFTGGSPISGFKNWGRTGGFTLGSKSKGADRPWGDYTVILKVGKEVTHSPEYTLE